MGGMIMKTTNTLIVIIFITLIFIGTVFTVSCSQSKESDQLSSNQSDYPILPDADGFVSFIRADSLEMLNSGSDLVIKGSIADVLPKEVKKIIPDPNSAEAKIIEKTGQKEIIVESYPIMIEVEDVIKDAGELVQTEITLYISSLIVDACPKFKTGDKFVFFLSKKKTAVGYVPMGPHDGFFYYAFDNKVYPAEVTEGLKNTSGMDYKSFRAQIS
jgi:hypothetical protein